jgi:hypothetical protein
MTKDGNDSDGLGDAYPTLWESHLTNADEGWIRTKCFIPNFIKIWFDMEKSGVVVRSDTHEVCLYEAMFKAGFQLPFILVVRELLGFLNMSPHQLSLNAWRTFFSCVVLWPLALGKEQQLSVKEFMHIYRIQRNPGSSRVYNFQTKRGKFIQLDSKYSSNRQWKNKYFFYLGAVGVCLQREGAGTPSSSWNKYTSRQGIPWACLDP